ncbi:MULTISPECIES: type II toxin-antitoxin system PemK/MazF family toxin [Escherichia]|uniref:type II toxin-antitoxin system PemK/MazF family toxin n=1 Tax=Escherichia TaxID=561 RepID=UPI00024827AA|nr:MULTISPECIES: type II toxin-antitoxin system PemK/MazF family toxin [Escherichia]EEV6992865.1 type II toxin-antitoxin system PemK/MazF family toxin [Escherichia coli]EFO1475223.1 type II toxin-antitoxin system PemK/MazF family toxin [Escherichia coli]MBB2334951.1 type II toxin-antitoxin system PemK/MazF family toxin [Escherichia sp. 93.0724]MCL0884267.1 type II toxin-antitoxin system PemK/MazF family toxin [Escherichia marmotae]MEC9651202.1 type II toxin-antitoxin system PemK/MazF family to
MVKARTPHRGEIWYFNPAPVAGHELRGPHYCIVVTDKELNNVLKVAMCCPISTEANATRSTGVTVNVLPHDTQTGNLHSVVLCHQLKAVDLIARGAKFHTVADETLISKVLGKLVNLIDPQ